MATLWNMLIILFDSIMAKQDERIKEIQMSMHQECSDKLETQTRELKKALEEANQQLKEEKDRTRSLTLSLEKKIKDCCDLS